MTVIDVPTLDLAPTVPSRIVYGTVLIPTEDRGPKGEWIEATIPGEIKLPGEHTTITGRSRRVHVNPDGSFQMRLPTIAAGIEPEDWALSMRLSWRRFAFPMRVPVGDEPIWIEDCLFPELVPGEDPSRYFLAGAQVRSVTMVGTDEPARAWADVIGGVLSLDYEFPRGAQGLPGVNAIENDEAVAGYISTPGESETKAALEARYANREHTATASRTAVEYWVSPTGNDADSGSQSAPLRTITKAMSLVPDMIRADHIYTITLAPGEWDEIIAPEHIIVYGQLIVQGSTSDPSAHRVTAVRAESVIGHSTFRNLEADSPFGATFRFYRCAPMVEVENVRGWLPEGSDHREGIIGLLADHGSQVIVRDSEFTNRRYGIRSNYLSRVFSRNNSGTGNLFGLGARWGGIMSTSGTQPQGNTDLTNSSGGILAFEHGAKLGLPDEPGLLSTMGHGDSSPVIKRYQLNSANSGINGDIRDGATIRARFRAPNDGYAFFRVTYGGQTTSSNAQSVERNFYGLIRRTEFSVASETTVSSYLFSTDSQSLTLTHAGADGIMDLRVMPLVAISGRWAIDIEMAFHRAVSAPALESVSLV